MKFIKSLLMVSVKLTTGALFCTILVPLVLYAVGDTLFDCYKILKGKK
jgi:hypothetical protein